MRKVGYIVLAIGLPLVVLGSLALVRKLDRDRADREAILSAQAVGLFIGAEDLARLAPPEKDDAMIPLIEFWQEHPDLERRQNASSTPVTAGETADLEKAVKEATSRKTGFRTSEHKNAFSLVWSTTSALYRAAQQEATKGDARRATELLDQVDRLCRVLATSRRPSIVREANNSHRRLSAHALRCSFLARKSVGDLADYSKLPPVSQSAAEFIRADCAEVLAELDDALWLAEAGIRTNLDEGDIIALKDKGATKLARNIILEYYTKLAKNPPSKLGFTDIRRGGVDASPESELGHADKILRLVRHWSSFSEMTPRQAWTLDPPPLLLPWYLKGCASYPNPPAGLASVKDEFGRPVVYKAYPGGFGIVSAGKNGRIEGMAYPSDDVHIIVHTPVVSGRTLSLRVALTPWRAPSP